METAELVKAISDLIDAKIQEAFAAREVGEDGYTSTPVVERAHVFDCQQILHILLRKF